MRVTARDLGVTATKRPRCDALLLVATPLRLRRQRGALSMGLEMKTNQLLDGRSSG